MDDDVALGVQAAHARARIGAPVADACLLRGTLAVRYALGSTVGRRTDELRQARARRRIAAGAAQSVRAAR